jgi:spoIIIJ-associated protein
MEGIEFKAHKVEQAIELGLKELQITADEAVVEVISQGGLFSKAVVKITPKIKPEQEAADFINNLFSYMKFDAFASLTKTEDGNNIEITGADSALLIGYRGDILDSVQYLALLVANKKTKEFVRISVDTENYREKRKGILAGLAKKLAQKADRTGRKVELEPMNPYERRVIHSTLQDSEIVTTESAGEEPNRYVVVIPKNLRPNTDGRAQGNGGRVFNRDKKYGGGYNNRNGNGGRSYNGDRNYNNRERGGAEGGRGYNNRERGYGGERGYNNRGEGGERSGYNGERNYNSSERGGYNGGERGYNNRSEGGERNYNNSERSGYNVERNYNNGERSGYNGERNYNNSERGERGGYNRGERSYEPRPRPDYSEDGAEGLTEKSENVQRETSAENEKDYSEVNNNFSNNFKKNGTKNFKSFGYKRR